MKRSSLARKVVTAGLGLAMALGSVAPAIARAEESTGNTNLYVIAPQEDLTTAEGSPEANIKVVLPVAIKYVSDLQGNLTGPADDTVKITNNTKVGTVHVKKIKVTPESGVTIVKTSANANADGKVYLAMAPGSNPSIALGDYLEEKQIYSDNWDIAQGSDLSINGLTGKIGGFGQINPASMAKVASIQWTIAPGTSLQGRVAENGFMLHLVKPDNTIEDYLTTTDNTTGDIPGSTQYTWKTGAGTTVAKVGDAITAAGQGATEITLYGTPKE